MKSIVLNLTILFGCLSSFAARQYCVIDISLGAQSGRYPVAFLDGVPRGGWSVEYKSSRIILRNIKAGSFMMGSPSKEVGHDNGGAGGPEDLHPVTLTQDFWMGVFEVTQAQWEYVMGKNPSRFIGKSRPVDSVAFDKATEFVRVLSERTGLPICLPTEAQWEYACRAGTTSALNSGKDLVRPTGRDANMDEVGRYNGNCGASVSTTDVGSYRPNDWGLYDMHGNVCEWCSDFAGESVASLGTSPVIDPVGQPNGPRRMYRGGCYGFNSQVCRSASRMGAYPNSTAYIFGVRLCSSPVSDDSPDKDKYFVYVGGDPKKGTVAGTGLRKRGEKVTIRATAGKGYLFGGWYCDADWRTPIPSGCLSPTYSFTVKSENVAFYAKFIPVEDDRAAISMKMEEVYETGHPIDPVTLDLSGCRTLPTVKVSSLPPGLKFAARDLDIKATSSAPAAHYDANTIYGVPSKSGVYTVVATVTSAGRRTATVSQLVIVRKPDENMVALTVPDIGGMIPGKTVGAGVYAEGKKVTIRATANKGYVFSGWYDGSALVSKDATLSFVMGKSDLSYRAAFVTSYEDACSVGLVLNGEAYKDSPNPTARVLMCGVKVNWPVEALALSSTSVVATKLPAGLKLVRDKSTGAYAIQGVPTKASAFRSEFKVSTAGKNVRLFYQPIVVEALPDWASGDFNGGLYDGKDMPCGLLSVTISTVGKLSGKILSEGKSWTLSEAGFDLREADTFFVTIDAKSGKETRNFPIAVSCKGIIGSDVVAYRSPWKTDAYKDLGKTLASAYRTGLLLDDGAQMKFSASGAVTTTKNFAIVDRKGDRVVYKATCSSVLLPHEDGYCVYVYFSPNASKDFPGECTLVKLSL